VDTKVDIIQGAYSQMRISGLTVQPTPGDVTLAIIRLEDMMEEFFGRGMCIGFNFEDVPTTTTPHGLARKYRHMAQTNLAIRMIPDFNKAVPQELSAQAKQSYSYAIGASLLENIRPVQAPRRMPRGSGNTLRYNRWQRFNRPADLPDNNCKTNNIIQGEINDYVETFAPYLEGETIQAFEVQTTAALDLISATKTDTVINYRIKALSPSTSGTGQNAVIKVITSTGRVHVHTVGFIIESLRDLCSSSNIAGQGVANCMIAG